MIRNVYLDTEFIPTDPTTGGLISIALTDNHGRDYYAINANINLPDVAFHPWLGKHVWPHLPKNNASFLDHFHPDVKPLAQIRDDITRYFGDHEPAHLHAWYGAQDLCRLHSLWGNDWSRMPEDIPRWFHELQSLAWQAGDPKLPQQDGGEHHALADAKYNRRIHEFLLASPALPCPTCTGTGGDHQIGCNNEAQP
ncbi:hypothetical protein [Kitasatospora sp. NPDC086791]|uniref:hypothetical protein n=1 Tax=Kitasatospora sp. NPDC086791 TaxID=3155178 RepID=UPI003421F651